MSYVIFNKVIYAIVSLSLKYHNLEKTVVSANQFVNVLLFSELKLRSYRDVEVPLRHFDITKGRQPAAKCVWSAVWAAVDVDVHVRERFKLLGHLSYNATVCAAFHTHH